MEYQAISVGGNIKEALFHANLSRRKLADALSVHINTVHKWINDESEPSYGTLGRIAQLTGQNILTLIDPEQVPFNRNPEVNFESWPRGSQPQSIIGDLLVGCVGGGDGRIRTAE